MTMLEQSELVGIIIALLGIFISIIIGLVFYISRSINQISGGIVAIKNIPASITENQRAINQLIGETRDIKESVKEIRGGPFVLPSPNEFLQVLAIQSKFWEKLFIQRADKVRIASTIASRYIQDKDTIIVDSGTTVDQIPAILRNQHPNVKVYTNNLLAAMSIVPPEKKFNCSILSGRIDPNYGATYNIGDIEGPLKSIEPQQVIIAATAISFEKGPWVDPPDEHNREFKQKLVKKALDDPAGRRLIIAVDWTKFKNDSDKLDTMNPVLDIERWRAVRGTESFVLVTTNPPKDLRTPNAIESREVIKRFMDNMENMKNGGMKIDVLESISGKTENQSNE